MRYLAYTDGSYIDDPEFGPHYGWASIVYPENNPDAAVQFTGSNNDARYVKHRNVAGEIFAVMELCKYCCDILKLSRDDELVIYYDYEGVHNWCKKSTEENYWKARKPLTIAYRNYMNSTPKTRFKITFIHVKSHAGDVGNDIVDRLARQAIYDKFNTLRRMNV